MPLAASQMRAVLSSDVVTMRDPSGLKAAEETDQLCGKIAISLPLGRPRGGRSRHLTP